VGAVHDTEEVFAVRRIAPTATLVAALLLAGTPAHASGPDPFEQWLDSKLRRTQRLVFTRLSETPQGNELSDAEIWTMRGDGTGAKRLTFNGSFDLGAVWSPNGQRIAFSGQTLGVSGAQVFVMDADGGPPTAITDPAMGPNAMFPGWSPHGDRLVFQGIAGPGQAHDIWSVKSDGTDLRRLTDNPAADLRADYSPDGRRIAFQSNRDGNVEIYVMNADGSGQTRLTDSPGADAAPDLSPDGRKLVFQSERDGNLELYTMNADGTGQTRLTNHPGRDLDPAWSPTGLWITFDRDVEPIADQVRQVHTIRPDGSLITQLTDLPSENAHAGWGPVLCFVICP
jgi:TolB protein